MKRLAVVAVGSCLLWTSSAFAKDEPATNPFSSVISQVPAAELPAKAAELVSKSKPAELKATTVSVVTAAVQRKPAAAPSIVGAIAKAVPDMAPTAAATAVALQPKLAKAITKAANAAAPGKSKEIALAVQSALQGPSTGTLPTVAVVAKGQPSISSTGEGATGPTTPLPPMFTPRGPTIQPPYVPLSVTPTNVTPSTSGDVPTGGRNYAAP
jgi:hypothetical protein